MKPYINQNTKINIIRKLIILLIVYSSLLSSIISISSYSVLLSKRGKEINNVKSKNTKYDDKKQIFNSEKSDYNNRNSTNSTSIGSEKDLVIIKNFGSGNYTDGYHLYGLYLSYNNRESYETAASLYPLYLDKNDEEKSIEETLGLVFVFDQLDEYGEIKNITSWLKEIMIEVKSNTTNNIIEQEVNKKQPTVSKIKKKCTQSNLTNTNTTNNTIISDSTSRLNKSLKYYIPFRYITSITAITTIRNFFKYILIINPDSENSNTEYTLSFSLPYSLDLTTNIITNKADKEEFHKLTNNINDNVKKIQDRIVSLKEDLNKAVYHYTLLNETIQNLNSSQLNSFSYEIKKLNKTIIEKNEVIKDKNNSITLLNEKFDTLDSKKNVIDGVLNEKKNNLIKSNVKFNNASESLLEFKKKVHESDENFSKVNVEMKKKIDLLKKKIEVVGDYAPEVKVLLDDLILRINDSCNNGDCKDCEELFKKIMSM